MKAVCNQKGKTTSRQAAALDETKQMTAEKKVKKTKHDYKTISET